MELTPMEAPDDVPQTDTDKLCRMYVDTIGAKMDKHGTVDCVLCDRLLVNDEQHVRQHVSLDHILAYGPYACKLCGGRTGDEKLRDWCCMRSMAPATDTVRTVGKVIDGAQDVYDRIVELTLCGKEPSEDDMSALGNKIASMSAEVRAAQADDESPAGTLPLCPDAAVIFRTWTEDVDELLRAVKDCKDITALKGPLLQCKVVECQAQFYTLSEAREHCAQSAACGIEVTKEALRPRLLRSLHKHLKEQSRPFVDAGMTRDNLTAALGLPDILACLWC